MIIIWNMILKDWISITPSLVESNFNYLAYNTDKAEAETEAKSI